MDRQKIDHTINFWSSAHYILSVHSSLGSDGTMAQLAYDMAAAEGFKIPFENVATFGSHSHSGPGAITPEMLWALAPATDLLVPGSHSNHDAIASVNNKL